MNNEILTTAREVVGGCWCDSANENKVMDTELAESFALRLAEYMQRSVELNEKVDSCLLQLERLNDAHESAERYRQDIISALQLTGNPHWGDIATVIGHRLGVTENRVRRLGAGTGR